MKISEQQADTAKQPAFEWTGGARHFVNACCKAIRLKHGQSFVTKHLIRFLHELFAFEEDNEVLRSEDYLAPTGLIIAEIRKSKDSFSFSKIIEKFQSRVSLKDIDSFSLNSRFAMVKVTNDDGSKREIPYSEWQQLMKREKPRQKNSALLAKLKNKLGVYLLYSESKDLLYIGKSVNLATRVFSSAAERHATYLRYILTVAESDAHILEPYLIATLNPPLNSEGKSNDMPSFSIPVPEMSEFIHMASVEE